MKLAWRTMAIVVPLAVVVACTDEAKAPAEAAYAAAGAAMDSLKGDATKYAPDAVKSLASSYDVAKASLANKDYQGVLTFAKDIPAKAKEVLAKVEAAKAELARSWNEAGEGMRKTVDAARSRLHVLSREKKLPPRMDRATLEKAQSSLASLEAEWAAAADQYKAGDWSGAVAKAKDLDSRGRELLGTLGAQPP
jgi:hypothetical protein